MLKVLDLFSGIGGFSLGLERTGGFKTVAFCEIEKYPRSILAQHWPSVRIYNDVKTLTAKQLEADGLFPNAICGGFPCQDISLAGKGAGLEGGRSGLWWEFHRLIKEIRPQWVIAENVSALRSRGLDTVLRSLSEIGYDAEWHCIPASAVGAPHQRDRIWIIAYPNSKHRGAKSSGSDGSEGRAWIELSGLCPDVANATSQRLSQWGRSQWETSAEETGARLVSEPERRSENVADTDGQRQLQQEGSQSNERGWPSNGGEEMADTSFTRLQGNEWFWPTGAEGQPTGHIAQCSWWAVEPNVGRVAHGVPKRVDRLKALGNAVVPQIPELIGYAILNAMEDNNGTA